ncbi:MAG: helix-turn-helix domain-containing protein [Robiginitomaculum sp.]|nr:helix-turn-helix domain-containing protein [Robiginitomaculum sp.]
MTKELKQHVAAAIRAARRAKGLTQEQLAGQIERTPESLSNIEREKALPSIETLVALSVALGISPSSLLPSDTNLPKRSQRVQRQEHEIIQMIKTMDESALEIAKIQLSALKNVRT